MTFRALSRPGRPAPAALVALSCALAVAAAVPAGAQPAGIAPSAAAPVLPDTARLGFVAGDSLAVPLSMHVLADSVAFGGLLPVAWDLPSGAEAPAALPTPQGDQLAALRSGGRSWWRPWRNRGATPSVPQEALAALPPVSGPRAVAWYRVYRTEPFRLEWAGQVSPPVVVRGRVEDPSQVAAIRDPRAWGWFTSGMALLLGCVLLVAALLWWWWRRRQRGTAPVDWPLPEPAWIGTALALEALARERCLERGEPKAFLDGLAALARRFAAAHYGVPAAELTGRELVTACVERGYDPAVPSSFARLIEAADLRRYDPEVPPVAWCRRQAGELLEQVAAARVQPRQTPVAAERLLAAGRAWTEAVGALTGGADDAVRESGKDER